MIIDYWHEVNILFFLLSSGTSARPIPPFLTPSPPMMTHSAVLRHTVDTPLRRYHGTWRVVTMVTHLVRLRTYVTT